MDNTLNKKPKSNSDLVELNPTKFSGLSDPWAIGAGALILGFAIGSGRWEWIGHRMSRLAQGLGSLALTHLAQSFQQKNSQFLSHSNSEDSFSKMTH